MAHFSKGDLERVRRDLDRYAERLGWTLRADSSGDGFELFDGCGDKIGGMTEGRYIRGRTEWYWSLELQPTAGTSVAVGPSRTRDDAWLRLLATALLEHFIWTFRGWDTDVTVDAAIRYPARVSYKGDRVVSARLCPAKRKGERDPEWAICGARNVGEVARVRDLGHAFGVVADLALHRADQLGLVPAGEGLDEDDPEVVLRITEPLDEELLERARRELEDF